MARSDADAHPGRAMTYVVARIGKPHGLRGEVTVQVHTDTPAHRFVPGAVLATEPADRGPLTLASVRVHQDVYLLAFAGHQDRAAAEALRGTRLVVPDEPEDELTSGQDEWREDELLGLAVQLPDGASLGEVSALHTRPAQDLLEVRRPDGTLVLVPFMEQFVPEIDEQAGRIVIDPPPGLLDLDGED